MSDAYYNFCEERLWQPWLRGELAKTPPLSSVLNLDAAPEPYLRFGAGEEPLIVLTTNPGRAEKQQLRQAVRAGNGPLQSTMTYDKAAVELGKSYDHDAAKISVIAKQRIRGFRHLAELIGDKIATRGTTAVLQLEAIPFHSEVLPKWRALAAIKEWDLLKEYTEQLRAFLANKSVLVLCAAGTRESLERDVEWSEWARHLASVAGVQREGSLHTSVVPNNAKKTCALWVMRRDDRWKAMLLMMGGNHLPKREGLEIVANAIASSKNTEKRNPCVATVRPASTPSV